MIDLRVLGTLEIHGPDGAPVGALTQPKRLALLLYLALAEPSGPKSRDSLMALLWPEADAESARHSLRNAIYALRQALGEAAFVSRGEGYVGLELGAVRCDALEVRRLLAEARWGEAVAGWGGELVPGFYVSGAPEFESWLEEQRTGLRRAVAERGLAASGRAGTEWRRRAWWRPRNGPGRSIRPMRRAPGDSCGFWTHPSGEPPRSGRTRIWPTTCGASARLRRPPRRRRSRGSSRRRTEPAASAPPPALVALSPPSQHRPRGLSPPFSVSPAPAPETGGRGMGRGRTSRRRPCIRVRPATGAK